MVPGKSNIVSNGGHTLVRFGTRALDKSALYRALDAFRYVNPPEELRAIHLTDKNSQYRNAAYEDILYPRLRHFNALSHVDYQLLAAPPFSFLEKLSVIDDAIIVNAKLASAIVSYGVRIFNLGGTGSRNSHNSGHKDDWSGSATVSDLEIARSTIRQFFRDWSAEGAAERSACHEPVLQDLAAEFSSTPDKSQLRILVPGAGLCRLAFNIATAGYATESNEISYHQLLASHFILSHSACAPALDLYPWALSFSNHFARDHQMERVVVPDVPPATILSEMPFTAPLPSLNSASLQREHLNINAADFTAFYGDTNHEAVFDAVTTVFFLDTAPNLLRYIETVRHCLKPGGIWINVGPLLWNCLENGPGGRREGDADDDEACKARQCERSTEEKGSLRKLEFTEEEVLLLLERYGFAIERHERCGEAGYIRDRRSMLQNVYQLSHWVARKSKLTDL